MTKRNRNIVIVGLLIALACVVAASWSRFYSKDAPALLSTVPLSVADGAIVEGFGQFHDSPVTNGRKTFSSDQYGISFTYPSNYFAFDATSTGPDQTKFYGVGILQDSSPLRQAIAGTHNEPGMIPRISFLMYPQKSSDISLD